MINISHNGIVTIYRGDSFTLSLPLNIGTGANPEYYTLTEGDKVYFAIMEPNQPFEVALVRKVFDMNNQVGNNIVMNFEPKDTECIMPGTYYYQIKLAVEENEVTKIDTLMPKRKFIILD